MKNATWVLLAAGVSALGANSGPALAETSSRAYVLDSGTRTLTALELPSGKRVASLALEGNPGSMTESPDGSRLVVFDRGPGEDKGERGYRASGKSSLTIVDPVTLTVVVRTELGYGIEAPGGLFSQDGKRLTVICPGYDSKNPSESLPRELVTVDPQTGVVTGRVALDHGPRAIHATRDGATLILLEGLPARSAPYSRSRLWFVDLAGPSVAARLELGGFACAHADDDYVYLLGRGRPDDNPQKNVNGDVQVVSVASRALEATKDAGRAPFCIVPEQPGGRAVLVTNDRARQGRGEGELRVLRGAEATIVKVAANPRLFSRAGDVAFVVGEREVSLVDPVALQVTGTVALGAEGRWLVDDDDLPTEVRLSPDGKRAFVLYAAAEKLVVLDLEHRKAVGGTKVGRGGKKFLRGMAQLNQMFYGGLVGGLLEATVDPFLYGYNPYSPAGRDQAQVAVRPDGAFAYALNRQTKDVTVVDAKTGEGGEKIGANGYELKVLTGGNAVAVVTGSSLHLLDTASNRETAKLELPGLRGLFVSPDGGYAIAPAEKTLLCLDWVTGSVLARLTDFVRPEVVVFAKPASPARP